jgi:hypothetical protein
MPDGFALGEDGEVIEAELGDDHEGFFGLLRMRALRLAFG